MTKRKSVSAVLALLALLAAVSCASSSNSNENAVPVSAQAAEATAAPAKKAYLGEDIVIAVLEPQMKSPQNSDRWIPQFVQDSITTNFARYSKMTVLDRRNEKVAVAEQELSESGFYDEEGAAEIGRMTNAQYILVGNIQGAAGGYAVNFRVNDLAKNETVQGAAFSKRYALKEIESGAAVQEISKEIMLGLGIALDAKALAALSKGGGREIKSNQSLAKGYAAQASGDDIEALYQFMLAGESGAAGTEAQRNTQQILNGTISGASVREKYAQQQALADKWNKIFEQLGIWLERNLPVFVYDFSTVNDRAGSAGKVIFTVTPGIKVVPNRNTVAVYKKVLSQWNEIKKNPENKDWVKLVKDLDNRLYQKEINGPYYFGYEFKAGLFAPDGEKFAESSGTLVLWLQRDISKLNIIPSQKQYFSEAKYREVQFNAIPIEYIPDDFEARLHSISREENMYNYKKQALTEKDFPVLSADEFKTQYNIR